MMRGDHNIEHVKTIRELLEYRARYTPDFVFGVYEDWEISCSTLQACVNRLANGLAGIGVAPGRHVAVMLGNHPDHIFTIFALAELGAVWIPVNVNLRGPSLDFVLEKSGPSTVIVGAEFWNRLSSVLANKKIEAVIVRDTRKRPTPSGTSKILDFSEVSGSEASPSVPTPTPDEIRSISFTSGTTGEPKGVLLTERMLMTFARGAAIASEVRPGDVFLLWESLYHNSGVQMCILALLEQVKLAIIPKFSASRFWDQIRKYQVTKMHYLGGIIDILLKYPVRSNDKDHSVQLAFGGGCSRSGWRAFEDRFGVRIQEVYGLTEASGFSTINRSGKVGSIGKPYPYFDVQIVDEEGKPLGAEQMGEIVIREKEPGLITQGYLDNPEETARALRGGWLYTGDVGYYDEEGDLFYKGRKKDSIRRRGENISAWEVERVLNSHPKIEESAVIGVDADVGEQELKAFIKCVDGALLEPLEVIKWCESLLPHYQIPRYVTFVGSFEKTPTERIRKENLSKDTTKCWDLERSGYRIERT
jgi:crotonobetaine/carnitine-CoA ligase